MNIALTAAGVLTIVIGLVHSLLGEYLIFRRMRRGTVVPTAGQPLLRERHVRILWATWHVVTVFGFGFAAILLYSANPDAAMPLPPAAHQAIAASTALAGCLVLYATKGRHPGWLGLILVAVCIWLA